MLKLNWYATLSQGQGYSGSSEQTVLALEKRPDVDVRAISFSRVPTKNTTKDTKKLRSKPFELADVGIVHGFPVAFDSMAFNKFKVGYTMFETTKLPKGHSGWTGNFDSPIEPLNKLDLLLTPSQFCVDLFREHGVTVPIEIAHNGVTTEQFPYMNRVNNTRRDAIRKENGIAKDDFVFLDMATLNVRKNPGAVITAFAKLFSNNPNVTLIMKTQSGTLGHMQFSHDMGNIQVIDAVYTAQQMTDLMLIADCFVYPSRAEGFGMPPLEAMATGLPTIVSNNSGMAEYAKSEYTYPIDTVKQTPAQRYPKNWGDVGEWFEPSYEQLKMYMQHVYDNQDEARAKGKLASDWVHKNFNYDVIANDIVKAIEKTYNKG